MSNTKHRRLFWGLPGLTIAGVLMAHYANLIPDGTYDILSRAWPAVLILIGLVLLLRNRLPFSTLISTILSIVIIAGVTTIAYNNRVTEPRDDQQVNITQDIDESITLLAINIKTLETDIELISTNNRSISAAFVGSNQSEITWDFVDNANGTAEFTLIESKSDELPALDDVGRGAVRVEVPVEIGIAIAAAAGDGRATFNLSDLWLERLSVALDEGNLLVTLPAYQPLSANIDENPGQLSVTNGDLTILVPEAVALKAELNRSGNNRRPEFHSAYILIDDGADGTLQKANIGEDDIALFYEVTAPHGLISLLQAGE